MCNLAQIKLGERSRIRISESADKNQVTDTKNIKEKNNKRPGLKRRNFFYMLGASVVGVIALSRSPLKLISSAFKSVDKPIDNKNSNQKQVITIKENPYSVKRGSRGNLNG